MQAKLGKTNAKGDTGRITHSYEGGRDTNKEKHRA